MNRILCIFLAAALPACSCHRPPFHTTSNGDAESKWKESGLPSLPVLNLKKWKSDKSRMPKAYYLGDPKLAGLYILQFQEGEGEYDSKKDLLRAYRNRHPSTIFFVYWDGRVRMAQYTPKGEIRNFPVNFWPERIKNGNGIWSKIDFNWGSDPSFKHHRDPR